MTYCANCGAPVDGRFCAKCGAPVVEPGATVGADVPPPLPPPAAATMPDNVAAALCYIPIIAIIFLLIEPYSRNRFVRFHAWQSIFYAIAWFVVVFALGIIWTMFAFIGGLTLVGSLLRELVGLAFLVGWIILVIKAYQRERFMMPVIGPLAEKQA